MDRRRGRGMEKTTQPYLPHELIIQILHWLPVKSLIRFKCVSKSWFSLISDPHFANLHFQLTAATHTPRILLISIPSLETRSIDLEPSLLNDHDSASASRNLSFTLPDYYFNVKIISSCRGFVLLHSSSNFYLWNPSTGIHKQMPFSPNLLYSSFYGFGYDHSTNDYLLVSMSPNSYDMLSHLRLFSLRDNAWKEIESTTHLPFYTIASFVDAKVGLLFNGAIHWLALRHDVSVNVIVVFHLTERILLEIPLPVDFDFVDRSFMDRGLWVFRGFLSMWVLWNDKVDIWVMKEYKGRSSWTKTLVLPIEDIRYFFPLSCTKSGDIIGTDGGTALVKFNNKGEFLEQKSYHRDAHGLRLTMYTESLLALPSDSEREQA